MKALAHTAARASTRWLRQGSASCVVAIFYSFLLISTCMASGEQAWGDSGGSTAIDTDACRTCVRAKANACAGSLKSQDRDLLMRICTPLPSALGIPISPKGSEVREVEYDFHFQPPRWRTSISLFTKPYSAAGHFLS